MTGRRRRNPDKGTQAPVGRAGKFGFARTDPFGTDAGAVLSVLILARAWPGRFSDGWATAENLGDCSRDLPKINERTEETLRRKIRFGIEELFDSLPEGTLERANPRAGVKMKDPRERATRLRSEPSSDLQTWFRRFGLSLLDPSVRKDFRRHSFGGFGSDARHVWVLEEAIVHQLAKLGDLDAATSHASRVLMKNKDEQAGRSLILALARIELRRQTLSGTPRAIELLTPLAKTPSSLSTTAEQLLQGRIHLTLATALAIGGADSFDREGMNAREHLQRAVELIPVDSLTDRGDLNFSEALIEYLESVRYFMEENDSESGLHHREKAEMAILAALDAWGLAMQWDRIRDALELLLLIPGGIVFQNIDAGRRALLFPWLVTLLKFWDVTALDDHEWRGVLCEEILKAFVVLPNDIAADDLPLPAQECHDLVRRCLASLKAREDLSGGLAPMPRHFLDLERTDWYRAQADMKKG